jgi:hypothetical protein
MTNLELKYAPRKCKHFVCGDCSISGRTCMSDYPECRAAELKETELQADIDFFNSKDRPLNSFEQGIKDECERLLNEQT